LKVVPNSALIDSGAQKRFFSYEAAARLHPSGRKKTEAPDRIRGVAEPSKTALNNSLKPCSLSMDIQRYYRP
jgi:hypothetical protein